MAINDEYGNPLDFFIYDKRDLSRKSTCMGYKVSYSEGNYLFVTDFGGETLKMHKRNCISYLSKDLFLKELQ